MLPGSFVPQPARNVTSRSEPPMLWFGTSLAVVALFMTGCSQGKAARTGPPPPLVSVVEVQPRTVPVYAEYAAQTFAREQLGRTEALGELHRDRLNVNGGAIALGHPVGATGTRLVLTLLKELHRRGLKRGLATLCVGGGQGAAVVVETP